MEAAAIQKVLHVFARCPELVRVGTQIVKIDGVPVAAARVSEPRDIDRIDRTAHFLRKLSGLFRSTDGARLPEELFHRRTEVRMVVQEK